MLVYWRVNRSEVESSDGKNAIPNRLQDHVVRVDFTIHREPLTDEDVELCFGAMQRGVQEFAKRHIFGRICEKPHA